MCLGRRQLRCSLVDLKPKGTEIACERHGVHINALICMTQAASIIKTPSRAAAPNFRDPKDHLFYLLASLGSLRTFRILLVIGLF